MRYSRTAFSLIELLVALSIIGVVAALVVPNLLGVQSAATATVAQQIQNELNQSLGQWKDAGGQMGKNGSALSSIR
jgi:type IV pilus assembly protein PilA